MILVCPGGGAKAEKPPGSLPVRSTAGREAVNFAIEVRILDGELEVSWQSGRMHLFAKQARLVASTGSNPVLTAEECVRVGEEAVLKTVASRGVAGSNPVHSVDRTPVPFMSDS